MRVLRCLVVLALLSLTAQVGPIPGLAPLPFYIPTFTIFTTNATTNAGAAAGYSLREICVTSGGGGTQVRASFKSGSGGSLILNHASIGISTGTLANTTATPVELTFNGGSSGFSISANTTITSDWVNLSISSGATVVIIEDNSNTAGQFGTQIALGGGNGRYYYAATGTYNMATPGAASGNDGETDNIQIVQVR